MLARTQLGLENLLQRCDALTPRMDRERLETKLLALLAACAATAIENPCRESTQTIDGSFIELDWSVSG